MSPSRNFRFKALARLVAFLLGMVCLCLVALQPFVADQMPYSADGLIQLYRAAALEHSLRVDHPLWPRYSSGLVYGYGAPLFNYFPPLAYYPASLAGSLGLSFFSGWRLSMSLYTVLAGVGMFLLGRLWTRAELGGWLAAAAYVYSPYLLFDSVTRGATAELAALAALPFALYGVTRLAFAGRRRDFLVALAACALFILLHTLMTLLGGALLSLYCLFLIWRAPDRRAAFIRLGLLGLLALMLTAFYWLPALVERDAIKLPLIAEQLGHIDVARHLRPLAEVFALPHTADPTQQNQAPPISLGWPQLILAAIGTALCWRAPYRSFRGLMAASWIAVALLVFLNTSHSTWFWQNIPLIGFTQFPWRTLGLASLMLALMAGLGAWLIWLNLAEGRVALAFVASAVVILALYAMPWSYTLSRAAPDVKDIGDAQAFERAGGQLALSSYGEYLPVSADADQLDAERLIARFKESDVIPRLLPSAAARILEAEWRGTSAALRLETAEAQTLVFDWLYVPGWSAAIDGKSVDVFPSNPAGLVAFEAPAGQFDLRIGLEATAAQSLAGALSVAGLALAIVLALLWRRLGMETSDPARTTEPEQRWLLIVAALGMVVFALKVVALDRADTPIKRHRFGNVADARALANFGGAIDLLAAETGQGYIAEPRVIFALYWRTRDLPLTQDYASIIRMLDPQGLVVAEASAFAPGGLATSNWLAGAYIKDVIALELPLFTPQLPGAYRFDVGLFDVNSLRPLSIINAAGDPQNVKVEIARRRLRYGETAVAEHALRPLPATERDGPALLFDAPDLPSQATAGDILRFSWVWQKTRASESDALAQLLWLDEAGQEAAASALPLVTGYNFVDWRIGEVNRGHQQLVVPPQMPAGQYRLGLRLLDAAGQPLAEPHNLDWTMTLALPPRVFEAPPFDYATNAQWDNGIVLHGFGLGANGDVHLVWGATKPLHESLRLFVHVLGADGRIAAQWDGVPADWTRPTTGWIEGEYIATSHAFGLPPGEYPLALGWYSPPTGERVKIGAADALMLSPPLTIN